MKEKNKKMRKFRIKQVVVILVSMLLATVFVSWAIYCRIQYLGGLNIDFDLIIAVAGTFALIFTVSYIILIGISSAFGKEDNEEDEKDCNFQNLKEYLDGKEKKVWYRCKKEYNDMILENIANHYKVSYFVKVEDDKVILITRNYEGDIGDSIEISSSFFHQYFEF